MVCPLLRAWWGRGGRWSADPAAGEGEDGGAVAVRELHGDETAGGVRGLYPEGGPLGLQQLSDRCRRALGRPRGGEGVPVAGQVPEEVPLIRTVLLLIVRDPSLMTHTNVGQ